MPFKSSDLGPDSQVLSRILPYPKDLPVTAGGALWKSKNNTFYKFGGYYPPAGRIKIAEASGKALIPSSRPNIWQTQFADGTFHYEEKPLNGKDYDGREGGGFASFPEKDLGFYIGGVMNNYTDINYTNKTGKITGVLLKYDMVTGTMQDENAPLGVITENTLTHVPIGEWGFLISLGGKTVDPIAAKYTPVSIYPLIS
jgi:hypothetical protein